MNATPYATTVHDIADLMRDLPKPCATLQQVEGWLNRKRELLGRIAVEQSGKPDSGSGVRDRTPERF